MKPLVFARALDMMTARTQTYQEDAPHDGPLP